MVEGGGVGGFGETEGIFFILEKKFFLIKGGKDFECLSDFENYFFSPFYFPFPSPRTKTQSLALWLWDV